MTRTINAPIQLPDAFLEGVMVTAFEGGIGYWFRGLDYRRTDEGYAWIAGYDKEDGFTAVNAPAMCGYDYLDRAIIQTVIRGEGWDDPDGEVDAGEVLDCTTLIDLDTIALGIERIVSGQVPVSDTMLGYITADLADVQSTDEDTRRFAGGNIDADAADLIVQAGLMGEVVYG